MIHHRCIELGNLMTEVAAAAAVSRNKRPRRVPLQDQRQGPERQTLFEGIGMDLKN